MQVNRIKTKSYMFKFKNINRCFQFFEAHCCAFKIAIAIIFYPIVKQLASRYLKS